MIYTLLGIRDHRAAVDRPYRVAFKDFPAALRGTATCHPAANFADGASSAGPRPLESDALRPCDAAR